LPTLYFFLDWELVTAKQGTKRKGKEPLVAVALDKEEIQNDLKFAASGLL
jgi:hypothetical protein